MLFLNQNSFIEPKMPMSVELNKQIQYINFEYQLIKYLKYTHQHKHDKIIKKIKNIYIYDFTDIHNPTQ